MVNSLIYLNAEKSEYQEIKLQKNGIVLTSLTS